MEKRPWDACWVANGKNFSIGNYFHFTLNLCPDLFFMKGLLNSIRIRVCRVAEEYSFIYFKPVIFHLLNMMEL